MRPVFANSAWVTAPEWAILRGGGWRRRRLQVRFGFFDHPKFGPVLIDTGYTDHTITAPNRSLTLRAYNWLLRPKLNPAGQLRNLGVSPEDIRMVIVTHFHADHVSGLRAFPNAQFMASGLAWEHVRRKTNRQNLRHGVFAELLPDDFAARMQPIENLSEKEMPRLPKAYDLFSDGSVLGVPLPGHADGHFGVYFPESDLLYAADTQWIAEALPTGKRPYLLPRLIWDDTNTGARSSERVAQFQSHGGKVLLCHDDAPSEFDLLGKGT